MNTNFNSTKEIEKLVNETRSMITYHKEILQKYEATLIGLSVQKEQFLQLTGAEPVEETSPVEETEF